MCQISVRNGQNVVGEEQNYKFDFEKREKKPETSKIFVHRRP